MRFGLSETDVLTSLPVHLDLYVLVETAEHGFMLRHELVDKLLTCEYVVQRVV